MSPQFKIFMESSMNIDHLIFRRQFFMGPEQVSLFPNWIVANLPSGYYLTLHPDLQITRFNSNDIDITLLGYILDPESPGSNNTQILEKKITKVSNINDVISKFFDLAGRYVCIVSIKNQFYFFSDTLGFRTLYYKFDGPRFWCASQPSLLSEYFNLKPDKAINVDLLNIDSFRNKTEHWYPGTITSFAEIFHLLPNHFLDITKKNQFRYWPTTELESLTIEESTHQCTKLLEKIMESAASRFDLEVAVTSGLDSRMVLAGCRSLKKQATFFTHTHPNLAITRADIRIPSMMCQQLGLDHKIIKHAEKIDEDFFSVLNRNVTNARKEKLINAFTVYNYFQQRGKERTVVHGVPGEIARNFFFQPPLSDLNTNMLTFQTRMYKSKLAHEAFESWLKEAKRIPKNLGVRILDLFYWEQRIGNWASMSYNEYDIAFESFTPFSCRTLLTTMLGVKSPLRIGPHFTLQRNIIRNLWPELLYYDINPAETITESIMKSLRNSIIYKTYKSLSYFRHVILQKQHTSK
jgi:hypothetical protein